MEAIQSGIPNTIGMGEETLVSGIRSRCGMALSIAAVRDCGGQEMKI